MVYELSLQLRKEGEVKTVGKTQKDVKKLKL